MSRRILVVEDELIIQLDLRYQLEQLGYEVAGIASSGEDAVTQAARLQPDLILMDVRLRGAMDGVEAAREICAQRVVPVIYLTAQNYRRIGNGDKELLQPCLAKPFGTDDLRAAITHALRPPLGQQRVGVV